ncbi:MAG: hypothetical protein RRB13_13010 [bacterium]|nr:hypothetical protein [bacterium]
MNYTLGAIHGSGSKLSNPMVKREWMSLLIEELLGEIKTATKKVRQEGSRKSSITFLNNAGIVTKKGEFTKNYSALSVASKPTASKGGKQTTSTHGKKKAV